MPGELPAIPQSLQNLINQVRLKMRDHPLLNRLIAGVESGDRFIAFAIAEAVDDWNATPPITASVTYDSHPSPYLLIMKAVIETLRQVMILQVRNHLTYSDGQGATVNTSDKAPALQAIIGQLSAEYEQKKQAMKIALNVEGGWDDSVSSELAVINTFYGW